MSNKSLEKKDENAGNKETKTNNIWPIDANIHLENK